jgi:ribosomal protein L7/L12
MSRSFQCPTCGAPLDVPADVGATMRCPYCQNSVVVPREMRDGDGPEWIEVNLASLTGDPDKLHELRNAMLAGKQMDAIKIFREMYDVGLADAQENIQDLMDGKIIRVRREMPTVIQTSTVNVSGATQQQAQAFQQALTSGNKIEAIKIYREMTGQGLKESKDAVEAILNGMSMSGVNLAGSDRAGEAPAIPPQPKSSRQVARTFGCIVALFFLIGAITLAAILLAIVPATKTVSDSIITVSTEILSPTMVPPPTQVLLPTQDPSYAVLSRRIGKEGICGGCFDDLRAVAQAPDGTIYATDYEGGRIQVFDSEGNFLTQWTAGEGTYTTALVALRDGTLVVNEKSQLLHYQSDGTFIDEWLIDGQNDFEDAWPTAEGGLVGIRFSGGSDGLAVFDSQGKVIFSTDQTFSAFPDGSEMRGRVAVDGLGNIYVLGTFKDSVLKYDSQGNFLTRFGSSGFEPGQFQAAEDIAVDQQGRIYVSDVKGIQVFDSTGRYLGLISDQGKPIFGLYVNDQNELLAAARTEIQVFTLP